MSRGEPPHGIEIVSVFGLTRGGARWGRRAREGGAGVECGECGGDRVGAEIVADGSAVAVGGEEAADDADPGLEDAVVAVDDGLDAAAGRFEFADAAVTQQPWRGSRPPWWGRISGTRRCRCELQRAGTLPARVEAGDVELGQERRPAPVLSTQLIQIPGELVGLAGGRVRVTQMAEQRDGCVVAALVM